jgi:hypothetical protein
LNGQPGVGFQSSVPNTEILFLPLSPPSGWKSRFDFFTGISIVHGLFSSGSVREVFGKASGFPEDFPKKPRRNPENNLSGIRAQILSGMTAKLLQNPRKENYRIRYRTLKSGFRAPPYLWSRPVNRQRFIDQLHNML